MHAEKDTLPHHSIQPMAEGDIDAALAIERLSFPNPWSRGQFESELKNPVSYSLTAKTAPGGVLAAYIIFWIVQGESHILNIAVSPAFRHLGLGSKLLESALEIMRSNLVYEVFLEVRKSNAAARAMYRKFGFKESFERKKYYGDEDAIVMVKDIEGPFDL